MNVNISSQPFSPNFSPVLIGETSPYLSPLCGSLSIIDQSYPEQLGQFYLEVKNVQVFVQQIEDQSHEENPESFMTDKDIVSQNQPSKPETMEQINKIKVREQIPKITLSKAHSIIQFLVQNDKQNESQLLVLGKSLYEGSENLEIVFRTLLKKFKKLKKTKQEMVKYCMRKAFKFVSDLKKSQKHKRIKKQNSFDQDKQVSFQMPFRKNSIEKTMNANFLKQVFSNAQFVEGYHEFLGTFMTNSGSISGIIEEDNKSKIQYLSESIDKILASNEIKEIENIKRLPWTKTILTKTQELSRSLVSFVNPQSSLFN